MAKFRFVEMDSVLSEIYDRIEEAFPVKRNVIKNYAQAVVKRLIGVEQFKHEVALKTIKNNVVEIEEGTEKFVQIAVKNTTPKKIKKYEIVKWTQQTFDGTGCELEINLVCPKCTKTECSCEGTEMIIDIDDLWRRSHPEHQYGHMNWMYSTGGTYKNWHLSSHHPEFALATPATSDFFGADWHIPGCLNLEKRLCIGNPVQYVIEDPYIRFNIKEGQVLMSYLKVKTDSDGYLLIPDMQELFDAIEWEVIYKLAHTRWLKGNQAMGRVYKDAQAEYRRAAGAVTELFKTPCPKEFWNFLDTEYHQMFKNLDQIGYYGRPAPDVFNNQMDRLTCHR